MSEQRTIVREQLYALHEYTLQRLNGLLSVEGLPFTLNHMYLKEYKDKFLAHYRDIRQRSRGQDVIIRRFQGSDALISTQLRNDIEDLTVLLRRFGLACTPADLPRLLPEDELEPALDIMATVRAYFQGRLNTLPLSLSRVLTVTPSSGLQTLYRPCAARNRRRVRARFRQGHSKRTGSGTRNQVF